MQIKNKAVVNEDTSGTVEALQKELRMLRQVGRPQVVEGAEARVGTPHS